MCEGGLLIRPYNIKGIELALVYGAKHAFGCKDCNTDYRNAPRADLRRRRYGFGNRMRAG